jgi:hypothetical protein
VSADGIRRKSTFEVQETDAFSASLNRATNGSVSGDTPGGYGDVLIPDRINEDDSTLKIFPPPVIPDHVDIIPPEPQPFNQASFLQVLLQEFRIIPFLFTVGFIVAGLTSVLILFVFKPDPPPPPTLEPTKEIVLCLYPIVAKFYSKILSVRLRGNCTSFAMRL